MMRNLLLVLLLLCIQPLAASNVVEAYQKYTEAERTKEPEEQKKLYNEALALYLQSEPQEPSAKFCYNLANTYFQLGEYGYAILYYYKALKVSPRDTKVEYNLQIAMQKAGVSEPPASFFKDVVLYFHYKISHNEKIVICLGLFLLVFVLFSLHIWSSRSFGLYKRVALWMAVIALAFVLSLFWAEYLTPPVAVIVQPATVRIDAGPEYAAVPNAVAIPGVKVEVLASVNHGAWLRVRLPSGAQGYIGKEYVRII